MTFMCDSWAEINLIKRSTLREGMLPFPIILDINGMCGGEGGTVGMIKVKIGKHVAVFHVMTDRAATFKGDRILGLEIFWEDGVDLLYIQNKFKVGDVYYEFLPRDKTKKTTQHWLDKVKMQIPEGNAWQNAEMEANIPKTIGGIFGSVMKEPDVPRLST